MTCRSASAPSSPEQSEGVGGDGCTGSSFTAAPTTPNQTRPTHHTNQTPAQSPHSNESLNSYEPVWAVEVVGSGASASAPSSPEEVEVMEEEDVTPAPPTTDQTSPQSPDQTPPQTPYPYGHNPANLGPCRACGSEFVADYACVHWPPRCPAQLCYADDCTLHDTCYCSVAATTPGLLPPTHGEEMGTLSYHTGRTKRALAPSLVKHGTRTALIPNPAPHCPPLQHPTCTVLGCTYYVHILILVCTHTRVRTGSSAVDPAYARTAHRAHTRT